MRSMAVSRVIKTLALVLIICFACPCIAESPVALPVEENEMLVLTPQAVISQKEGVLSIILNVKNASRLRVVSGFTFSVAIADSLGNLIKDPESGLTLFTRRVDISIPQGRDQQLEALDFYGFEEGMTLYLAIKQTDFQTGDSISVTEKELSYQSWTY